MECYSIRLHAGYDLPSSRQYGNFGELLRASRTELDSLESSTYIACLSLTFKSKFIGHKSGPWRATFGFHRTGRSTSGPSCQQLWWPSFADRFLSDLFPMPPNAGARKQLVQVTPRPCHIPASTTQETRPHRPFPSTHARIH